MSSPACAEGYDAQQREDSTTFVILLFYANNRWLRRPGPWPGAEAVTGRAVTVSSRTAAPGPGGQQTFALA